MKAGEGSPQTARGTMTNAEKNQAFLVAADAKIRDQILAAVANHYQITPAEVMEELINPCAEHLLDYLTGSIRTATSLVMRRAGFA